MRNRDSVAYPKANPYVVSTGGLTKREAAAMAAMQGLLANKRFTNATDGFFALSAVAKADALFDELDGGQENG